MFINSATFFLSLCTISVYFCFSKAFISWDHLHTSAPIVVFVGCALIGSRSLLSRNSYISFRASSICALIVLILLFSSASIFVMFVWSSIQVCLCFVSMGYLFSVTKPCLVAHSCTCLINSHRHAPYEDAACNPAVYKDPVHSTIMSAFSVPVANLSFLTLHFSLW